MHSGQRRVVDNNIQAAVALHRQRNEAFAIRSSRDVCEHEFASATIARDELVGWLATGERITTHIREQNHEAVHRQSLRDGSPDA
jgi:hypothetical protein